MKTIPIALAAHYAQRWHSVCMALKVTLADTTVLGFVALSRALPIDGLTYKPSLAVSALSSSDVLSADNLDMTLLPDDGIALDDLLAGTWRGAKFQIFELNYASVSDGINPLKSGTVGELKLRGTSYVLEFLSLSQALQQTQGDFTSKTCRNRLGDARCKVDLTPFTYTGALTSVAGRGDFIDSGRGEPEDWFAEGPMSFNTGANAGFTQKVKLFNVGGRLRTSLPFPRDPAIGDTYTVIAGCRKRAEEDCFAKFNNVVNRNAEDDLIGLDRAMQPDSVDTAQPAATPTLPADSGGGIENGT